MAKDLFSTQAADYAKYRPSYPAALIDYVTGFAHEKKLAWDCATGNGQAAVLLAHHFENVIATDLSEKQLAQAIPQNNITYSVSKAEQTSFADNTFDLISVAQAYHWFQFDAFEKEAKRVGKPGCVVAVWGYNLPQCDFEDINQIILHFYTNTVGPYWDAERKYVETNYETLPFNFEELQPASFLTEVTWSKHDVPGYLNSWSSTQNFIKASGYNPVNEIATILDAVWPKNKTFIAFNFPVFLRIGSIRK